MPRLLALLLLLPLLAACTSEPPRGAVATATATAAPPATGAVFEVFKGAERYMTVTDEPGFVIQGGTPPPLPGSPQPKLRPFSIYAHALVPGPGVLEAIETSQSTRELLDRMKGLGYRVTPP
jgi:hypothetical protein